MTKTAMFQIQGYCFQLLVGTYSRVLQRTENPIKRQSKEKNLGNILKCVVRISPMKEKIVFAILIDIFVLL